MHRQPLLRMLDRYLAAWPEEAATVAEMQRFVAEHADCFERTLAVGHLTGSAWLVDGAGERALLTHHRKLNRWLQLGGHADGDTDLLAVAVREAKEESGLEGIVPLQSTLFDIDIHEIPARGSEAAHLHYDCRFLLQATDDEPYRVSDESHALGWVDMRTIEELTAEESVLRMARKFKNGVRSNFL